MGMLDGKVAIVTGGGDGLGLSMTKLLSEEGAAVVATGRRQEKVSAVADEITANGGKALGVRGDVGKRADVDAVVKATVNAFGTVDILVNNAMAYDMCLLEELTDAHVDKIARSGLYGTIYMMQACFPYMKEHGGKIINFGSMAGAQGLVGHAHYSAIKQGTLGLTRTAALEWGKYGINVNAILPLATSAAWENFRDNGDPAEVQRFLDAIPLGRVGESVEVARVVLFFASELSNWVTGRSLFVDGGQGGFR